jgi:hypothetical protein
MTWAWLVDLSSAGVASRGFWRVLDTIAVLAGAALAIQVVYDEARIRNIQPEGMLGYTAAAVPEMICAVAIVSFCGRRLWLSSVVNRARAGM